MKTKNKISLSIVLPTYNERENILILIPLIEELLKKEKLDGEIIVVDDSSPDGTSQTALELNKKYNNIKVITRKKKEGIGAALIEGYNNAVKEIILSMDTDLSFDHNDIIRLIAKINQGHDLVVGCRHLDPKNYESRKFSTSIKRKISEFSNKLTSLILGLDIHDFSANFRAIKSDAWSALKVSEKGNLFLLEMIIEASSKGYRITEVPVTFKERIYGTSKVSFNFIKEMPKAFFKLVKVKVT
jgi:dolichol-phosphate mannosyltransferase